jgi:hypothetical protein
MNPTLSKAGNTFLWIQLAPLLVYIVVLSIGLGYAVTAASRSLAGREARNSASTELSLADPDRSLPASVAARQSMDRCAWEYTLWIGAQTHPFGC